MERHKKTYLFVLNPLADAVASAPLDARDQCRVVDNTIEDLACGDMAGGRDGGETADGWHRVVEGDRDILGVHKRKVGECGVSER